MVKKVFALASVTALAGLIVSTAAAGCSSTTTVTDDSGTGTDAKSAVDASRPDTATPAEDSGPATCPTTDPIDTSMEPFTAPNAPVAGACTPADFAALESTIKGNSSATTADLEAAVSATCKACAFGPSTATTWTPIVTGVVISGTAQDIVNVGACVAVASGKADCGKAYAAWSDCLETACQDCADSASVQTACGQKAQGTGAACDAQTQALSTSCGADVNNYLSTCQALPDSYCGTSCAGGYLFEPEVAALCGKAPSTDDGG